MAYVGDEELAQLRRDARELPSVRAAVRAAAERQKSTEDRLSQTISGRELYLSLLETLLFHERAACGCENRDACAQYRRETLEGSIEQIRSGFCFPDMNAQFRRAIVDVVAAHYDRGVSDIQRLLNQAGVELTKPERDDMAKVLARRISEASRSTP